MHFHLRHYAASLLAGAVLVSLPFAAGCSLRVGHKTVGEDNTATAGGDGGVTGGPVTGADASPDAGPPPPPPSACARNGNEMKIATGPGGSDTFAWIWDTDHYVVAYNDRTTGNGDIYTVLLKADGSPMGAPQVVESTDAISDLPNLVKTQNGYLVVWQEGSAGKSAYAHAIDKNGVPVGKGISIGATASNESRPVISAAPGGFAVAFMDKPIGEPTVQVAFLDGNMNLTGPTSFASSSGFPWLAGDENGVGMIWSDRRAGAGFDIHFARLDTKLAPVGETPLRSGVPNDALLGRMIHTTFGFMSAWEDMRGDDNQIFMALTDPNGKQIYNGLVEEPNSGDANWPNIAWTGSAAAVVYYQFRNDDPQIFMSFIDGAGKRVGGLHDLQVSANPKGTMARFPDVVWTGSEFGVAWVDTREGKPELYFAHVTCKN